MELQHFSHEHPLILKKDHEGKKINCLGCGEAIFGPFYDCSLCKFFLHKSCAELPHMIVKHQMHSSHPLTLCTEPPSADSKCKCHACGNVCQWYTYRCSHCDFYIHPLCAFLKHESHKHILTLLQRPALFYCDACGLKNENESSYVCLACQFWIHTGCALLPSSLIISGHHDHYLDLVYSLPLENSKFTHDCDICTKKVKPLYWAYSCSECRYIVHVKCATSKTSGRTCRITADEKDFEPYLQVKGIQKDDSVRILHLPAVNDADIVSHFIKETVLGSNKTTRGFVKHHEHPLQLVEQNTKVQSDKTLFCYECEQPILAAFYYSCNKCSFSLHRYCAASLREVQHQCHPDHKLFLRTDFSNTSSPSNCNGCDRSCRGFTLNCDPCNFHLHLSCGSLLNSTVAHEAHSQHPLVPSKSNRCNACGVRANFTLGCDTCGFYLDTLCAQLPGMVRHIWDYPPLILSYPPYTSHPDKSNCQFCYEEINPEFWHYRFHEYEKWMHPKCIGNSGYLNIMFGDTIIDDRHRHALKWVEYSKDDFRCNCCKRPFNDDLFFECAPCNFQLCYNCHVLCSNTDQNQKIGAYSNLMHLPTEKSVALMYRFVKEMGLGGRNSAASLKHFSHDHPLQLFEEQNNESNNYLTLLCDGCVQPVSALFYSCTECNFFLHKCCAALPKVVQHPCHLVHMLVLRKIHYTSLPIRCDACHTRANGFVLSCDPCDLTLHVRCASLLNNVKAHDAHRHPLVPKSNFDYRPCNACGKDFARLGFQCNTCSFGLDSFCALLPRKVRHRGDKHDLILSFPPYTYHREEFYCDFCEREINPNFWIYYCRDCDQSFHPRCIDPVQRIQNLKYGDTVRVNNHPHFLKRVQQSLKCSICGKPSYADISFDCISCHFQLCYDCATVSVQ